MIDDINAEPDYGDEPPFVCFSRVFLGRDSFACGGTPGHAGKHDYRLPWVTIEWDGRAERAADAVASQPAPGRDALVRLAAGWERQAFNATDRGFAAGVRHAAETLRLLLDGDGKTQSAPELPAQPPSPEPDGTIAIGLGCFASSDKRVITWRGINYYPWASDPDHQAEFATEAGQPS